MGAWTYKSFAIVQKNRRKGNRWISTACFRTHEGEFDLTAHPVTREGYARERMAQYATEKLVREHIDKFVLSQRQAGAKRV